MNWTAILLSGGIGDRAMGTRLGMSHEEFPVSDSLTAAAAWSQVIEGITAITSEPVASIRLRSLVQEPVPMEQGLGAWRDARDVKSHRGVAGAIADTMSKHSALVADWVLVIESSASPDVDLDGMFMAADSNEKKSVVLGISSLDRPCGCYLARRELFDLVPEVGFFDFKEQLLSLATARQHRVDAVRVADRARRLRTREGWLACVESWNRREMGESRHKEHEGPWRRRSEACAVSPSACVDGAILVSSVVMQGASVGSGAVVARSIVGPGAVVPPGSVLVDGVQTTRKSWFGPGRRAAGSHS